MPISLYRKYRPQSFAQIVGQNHVKLTLQNEITLAKISHAYLFSGPHGVGKTTMARILTKSLNCRDRQGFESCNQCSTCLEINQGRSLDMIEIDAASNRGINEIRELREQVKFVPLKEQYKVFIIDEVHMLTTEAFNALLKTLEEPPAHVIFVLATTEIQKVPETIISRCQHFEFKKVSFEDINKHLYQIVDQEGIKVDKKVLANIARQSSGYLRDAVSLLGQVLSLGDREISEEEAMLVLPRSNWQEILEFLNYLFRGQTAQALQLIQKFVDQGGDLEFFSKQLVDYLRKIMLAKVTDNWQELLWDLNQDAVNQLNNALVNLTSDQLRKMLEYFLQALQEIRSAEILQLPLELAVVKIGQLLTSDYTDVDQTGGSGNSPSTGSDSLMIAETKDTASKITKSVVKLSLEQILKQWPKVISELKSFNHSLASFVKEGLPLRIEENYLVIGFKYNFHWERVKDLKNKRIVEETVKNVLGEQLLIKGEINEHLAIEPLESSGQNNQDLLETVLETLGGEVINN